MRATASASDTPSTVAISSRISDSSSSTSVEVGMRYIRTISPLLQCWVEHRASVAEEYHLVAGPDRRLASEERLGVLQHRAFHHVIRWHARAGPVGTIVLDEIAQL